MDSHALAAAYIAAGYTVMPLQQYEGACGNSCGIASAALV